MNKKVIIYCLFALCFFFPIPADAANLCTGSRYNELKRAAYNVQLSWNLKFDSDNKPYFEITASNMNKDVLLIFNDSVYETPNDNATIVIASYLDGGHTYEFKFYGGYDSPCAEEYIYTRQLKVPKYNTYSESEECIEYEEFPLCGKWYEGSIRDREYFLEQLEIYKKSIEKPVEPEPVVDTRTTFQKIIDYYVQNLSITLPITIVFVGLVVTIIVIRIVKSRKRTKINLNV